jgi:hypothetical protein
MVPILNRATALAISGLLAIGASSARGDLDLTPSQDVRTLERVPIMRVLFHDGAKEITYQPPRGWTCTGSQGSASLSVPDHPQAKVTIVSAARVRIPAFDDKAEKLFVANPGLLELPKGAKNVQITEVDVNPLVVDSHPTLEVQLTYSFYGQSCAKSILLINRNGAEVSCVLDSPAPDYQALHTAFRSSIFSFENL